MRRGTTPTHIFTVDVDLREATVLYITYAQRETKLVATSECLCSQDLHEISGVSIILEKTLEDIMVEETQLTTQLTQEETIAFRGDEEIMMQIAAKFPDGSAIRSNIIYTDAQGILKDEVI